MALMGLHTRLIVSAEYYEVYIILRYLYMWLHFDIYIDVLCVPAYWSRDGTVTQRLDRLRSGRYTKKQAYNKYSSNAQVKLK